MSAELYITVRQAAELRKVSLATVRNWCRQGLLPSAHLRNGCWIMLQAEVEALPTPKRGCRFGSRRSMLRENIRRLMSDGQPRTLAEIARIFRCSRMTARLYLREIGATYDTEIRMWSFT